MDYFVTVGGITIARNITKDKAIALGQKEWNSTSPNIGIGKNRIHKGKKIFTLLPLNYFI